MGRLPRGYIRLTYPESNSIIGSASPLNRHTPYPEEMFPPNTFMELRHLRYFVAVAECGSFRAAAERIHITQPAITRQIQDLESEVGIALLRRTTTGVVLTPAGERFMREVRPALAVLNAAPRLARRVADGLEGSLRLGFVENSSWEGLVPDAFARYQEQAPDIHLELLPLNSPEQIDMIVADRMDGGFIYAFDAHPPEITVIPLIAKNVVLAVPRQWGWPADRSIIARDLNDTPMVAFPRQTYPGYYDYLIETCRNAGLTLNVVQEVSTEAAMLSLVSAGIGASIVNAANLSRPPARVQFLELADLPMRVPLAFAYRQAHDNPALTRFIAMLRTEGTV